MCFDGHCTDDVIEDTNVFLKTVEELDKKSLISGRNTSNLEEGEKPQIRVIHASSDQSFFGGMTMKHKSLRQSIVVSDFVEEVSGFLRDGDEMALVMLETQRDGDFNNDHLMCQGNRHLDCVYSQAHGIFIFDNASSNCG